jgi:hypothetical protein
MRIVEFERHIAAHGTDLAGWPPELRDAAEALLAASDEARALLRSEEGLNALFAEAAPPAPEAATIVVRATSRPRRRTVPFFAQLMDLSQPVFGWARIAVFASCLSAGFVAGVLSPLRQPDSGVLNLVDGSAFEVNDE